VDLIQHEPLNGPTLSTDIPIFTDEALGSCTVEDLKGICKKYNIKYGKKKADYVTNIVTRSNTVHQDRSEVEKLVSSILATSLLDPAPAHIFYRENFNPIDLADGYWYACEEKHAKRNWKTKMLLAMLRFAVMNAWVASTRNVWYQWLPWRGMVAKQLMTFNLH
jgi:hypothetical protein